MDRNPLAGLADGVEGSNAHSRICQKPLDFINTQISDLITSYFKNHVMQSRCFVAFSSIKCRFCVDSVRLLEFAPGTLDILKEDANDLLWKVISLYENCPCKASRNLISRLPTTHLFRCTKSLLTLISPNECMSECMLHEGIAKAWFKTSVCNIMEERGIPPRTAFRHVFIGEKRLLEVSGLHYGGRVFLLHQGKNLQVTSVSKEHNAYKIINLSFLWDKLYKRMSTVFFGLPVEFEVLLYFICSIQSGTGRFKLLLDQSELTIMTVRKGNSLSTAYFII
ncbi:Poly U specific endoribonuclease-B [Taenia solium]|eukprot:TsM_000321700 transcript=TsM_000321700 gene=TsM_000321700